MCLLPTADVFTADEAISLRRFLLEDCRATATDTGITLEAAKLLSVFELPENLGRQGTHRCDTHSVVGKDHKSGPEFRGTDPGRPSRI